MDVPRLVRRFTDQVQRGHFVFPFARRLGKSRTHAREAVRWPREVLMIAYGVLKSRTAFDPAWALRIPP